MSRLWIQSWRWIVVLMTVWSLSACGMFKTQSKDEAFQDMQWDYGADGIAIDLTAEPDLNWWGGQAHTLLVQVIQLEDLSALEKYKSSSQALSELLMQETAPTGLLSLQRYFLAPGAQLQQHLARVDKSRYVALVMGYQHLDPQRSIRVYQIGVEFERKGWVFRVYQAQPEPVQIQLQLGADGILSSRQQAQPPFSKSPPQAGWLETPAE